MSGFLGAPAPTATPVFFAAVQPDARKAARQMKGIENRKFLMHLVSSSSNSLSCVQLVEPVVSSAIAVFVRRARHRFKSKRQSVANRCGGTPIASSGHPHPRLPQVPEHAQCPRAPCRTVARNLAGGPCPRFMEEDCRLFPYPRIRDLNACRAEEPRFQRTCIEKSPVEPGATDGTKVALLSMKKSRVQHGGFLSVEPHPADAIRAAGRPSTRGR